MALSLHTTKTYKVEYGQNAINGWDEVEKFIQFLYEKRRDADVNSAWNDVYINEEETDIQIPFSLLEELKDDATWGKVAEIILENSDRDNREAYLSIW